MNRVVDRIPVLLLLLMSLMAVACSRFMEEPQQQSVAREPLAAVEPRVDESFTIEFSSSEPDATDAAQTQSAESVGDVIEPVVAEAGPARQVRVALILPSSTTDLAWSQSIYDSLVAVQAELGGPDALDISVNEGMFMVDEAAATIRAYAEDGVDVIIAHGTQYGTPLFEIALDFPMTAFAYGTSRETGVENGIPNVHAYDAQARQGGFVNGTIAAGLTESGIIGVVGPIETGDAKLYIEGFINGAQAIKSDVEVLVTYTGSFGDTALAADAARAHVEAGADVLTGSAQQVIGAIDVADEYGLPWLGTQHDQSVQGDNVVATQQYDWTGMLHSIFAQQQSGVYGGSVFELTLANEGLTMIYGDLDPEISYRADFAAQGIALDLLDTSNVEVAAGMLDFSDE